MSAMRRAAGNAPSLTRTCRVGAALFALLAAGCASGGVDLAGLPEAPIAVTFWEGEDARRRAELLAEPEKRGRKRGVAEVEAIGRMFGLGGSGSAKGQEAHHRFPGRLVLIDPRTGEVNRIDAAPRGSVALAWSSDHERLLFLSSHQGGVVQVYEYDRATEVVRRMTHGRMPHIEGDYGRDRQIGVLALQKQRAFTPADVYLSDENGALQLVHQGDYSDDIAVAPDGTALVLTRYPKTPSGGPVPSGEELLLVPLSGSEPRVLARGRQPVFTPDGQWIVYSAPSRGGWQLRRMRPDGSARALLGAGIRDEKSPAVSPDGRFIVYVGETTGLDRLFVKRIDGTGDRILLDEGAVLSPVW